MRFSEVFIENILLYEPKYYVLLGNQSTKNTKISDIYAETLAFLVDRLPHYIP